MDQLLKEEDKQKVIKCYANIDLQDKDSQLRLQQLAWEVVVQITNATDAKREGTLSLYKNSMKKVYDRLMDLILVIDMPLENLFSTDSYDLEELFNDGDMEDYQFERYAYSLIESLAGAMQHLSKENILYYYLDMAHFVLIKWLKHATIKPQEVLL